MIKTKFSASLAALAVAAILPACTTTDSNLVKSNESKAEAVESTETKTGTSEKIGYQKIGKPYKIKGKWYTPAANDAYNKTGLASWYGPGFNGGHTANGETYDQNHLSAAHKTLPLPSYVRVTNLETNSSVVVRVNDRGPFVSGRIIDLSKKAAEMLDVTEKGTAEVRVDYIGPAPAKPDDMKYLLSTYQDKATLPEGVSPDRFGDKAVQVAQIKKENPDDHKKNTLLAMIEEKKVIVGEKAAAVVVNDRVMTASDTPIPYKK